MNTYYTINIRKQDAWAIIGAVILLIIVWPILVAKYLKKENDDPVLTEVKEVKDGVDKTMLLCATMLDEKQTVEIEAPPREPIGFKMNQS